MQKINICLLGCGSVAKLHSRVARTMKSRIDLSYASRDIEKAREYQRMFKGVGAFGSYEEACADPDVDAVFICTPHAYHVEHARLAAKHSKPMLIEKPITRTLEELSEIENAVQAVDVPCMVAENYFFKPLISTLHASIADGAIGDPLFIELNRTKRSKISGWRADAEMMGGGALLEGGVHWINLICSIGGEVSEVLAAQPGKAYKKIAPFEDSMEVLFKFSDGTIGKMLHSWNLSNRIGGLCWSKICGTEGNIQFESNGVLALLLGKKTRLYVPGLLDLMGYREMLKHFVDCVIEQRQPAMSLRVARRDMAIVHAAYTSLSTGKFERVAQ